MKKLLSIILMAGLFSGLFSGCKKDKGDPPDLPPMESMTIDFSNFAALKKSAVIIPGSKGVENSNWEFAATVAVIWSSLLTNTLAVPVAAFKLAFNKTPVYLSDKTWEWGYSVSAAGATYNARLTGQIGASEVLWKMYVMREGSGGFPEFVWFEGKSKPDGTSGQWILNQNAQNPEPILQIDWTKNSNVVGSIKYTYVKNADSFKTSYIEYGLTSSDLNAYYKVHYYNGVKFSDVDIEWNTSGHNGRVKSMDYLLGGTWYCWDSNKINVACQ